MRAAARWGGGWAAAALALLYFVHNDIWWAGSPLIAGLPVTLLYHLGYCVVVSIVMAALLKLAKRVDLTAPEDE